ncbi:hypothetical protein MICAC_3210001 [Microcystis aeruginosa PCC 9443]|uniref:Uncharacterized protein n=1 Tax=Microcystis aeruginosa PCC 9443 TaxID=1160281 RepID=I4G2X5_MICAE|nr:hypothetical protein MICAC_3210001 [Microcystis aeruginosa PCC 9443]
MSGGKGGWALGGPHPAPRKNFLPQTLIMQEVDCECQVKNFDFAGGMKQRPKGKICYTWFFKLPASVAPAACCVNRA